MSFVRFMLIFALAAAGVGCASTDTINPRSQHDTTELTSLLEATGTARLVLEDGRKFRITRLQMTEEETSFTTAAGEQGAIKTTEIYAIIYDRKGRGALEGGFIGGLAGSLPLLWAGVAATGDQDNSSGGVSTNLLASLVVTGAAITVGAVVGAFRGHEAVYEMGHPLGDPRVEPPPAPSTPLDSEGPDGSPLNP